MSIKRKKRTQAAIVPAVLFSALATSYPYQSEPGYQRTGRSSAPRQTRLTYHTIRRPIISGRLIWYSRRLPRF